MHKEEPSSVRIINRSDGHGYELHKPYRPENLFMTYEDLDMLALAINSNFCEILEYAAALAEEGERKAKISLEKALEIIKEDLRED